MEERFLELAQNKDITDEELFEELCYVCAKACCGSSVPFECVKKIREENPTLNPDIMRYLNLNDLCHEQLYKQFSLNHYALENYEMKKRIQTLEQTLAAFMEQTKVERLSQEAVMQSLSNELDEFQEEFYDCQSELKEQKERIGLIEDALKETIQKVMEPVPFVKDKMA